MPPRIDPDSFGFLINDVARLTRAEVDRLIGEAGLGLTPGEVRTLTNVARAGCVRQNMLADRMGVEAMTVCGYLDRLEAQGMIHRAVDPTDRRAKLVQLTDAADAVLSRLTEVGTESRRIASAGLSADEWATLQQLLRRVRDTLSESRAGGRGDAP